MPNFENRPLSNPFKVGDRVVFKANENGGKANADRVLGVQPYYMVLESISITNDHDIVVIGRADGSYIEGETQGWYYWRFELVPTVKITLDDSLFED
jgi:hypothetical protein